MKKNMILNVKQRWANFGLMAIYGQVGFLIRPAKLNLYKW